MVDFGKTNYFNAMDKEGNRPSIHISELGVSSKMGDIIPNLKGDIASGASHVELGFMGTGKGSLSGGNTTPEMFDKEKREEIRLMSKINGVSLSTHASVKIQGFAGFNPQARTFSEKDANENLIELKRTIDFAADTAGGGAIVCHTTEFPRMLEDDRFEIEPEREKIIYFADSETGEIKQVTKGQEIYLPDFQKDKQGNYIDIEGKKINNIQDFYKRVPVLDEEGNIQDFKPKTYNDIKKETQAWNNKNPDKKIDPNYMFFMLSQRESYERSFAFAEQYSRSFQKTQEDIKLYKKRVHELKEFEAGITDPKKLAEFRKTFEREGTGKYANEVKLKPGENPSDWWAKKLKETETGALREKEGYMGYRKEIEKIEHSLARTKSIEEVGLERTAKTLANAAMYAYEKEKKEKLKSPLFIAPENLFPEGGYGSHPEELKKIIQSSREAMIKQLNQKGIKGEEAKKIAREHIKATFDIGHANTWSKYFKGDKKEFDNWIIKEVKGLVDEGIIGHVHLSDNFGYYDEHLTPGAGNAPIQDFLKSLKDKKYEGKLIVEWGAQASGLPSEAMIGAWANLANSPIYRVEGQASPKWEDLENTGYFATASSPFMTVGKYATALGKDWQLWSYSEAPIE
ncbi:MAG: TIM barrel protein [Nanoarchaeota archaeon]|nr:TIM barrel protein [Nanoarchaeota archaeon]